MESYKENKFIFVISVLSILILCVGGTFSFFSVSNKSKYDAVKVQAQKIQLALNINPLYTGHKLIPTNDYDIMKAYQNKCVDIYKRGACLAYDLEVSNFNGEQDIIGQISFEVNGINNLSYMLLDEEGKEYLGKTSVLNGKSEKLSLGEHFILGEATENDPATKKLTLLIWLTNLKDEDQTEIDADGSFSAAVSFESITYGSKLTGTVNGYGGLNDESIEGDNA